MRDFIGSGLAEAGPNKNVINIIRVLVEDKDSTVYIPYSYAKETSGKGKDPRVHFPPKESGRPMQITDIQGHQERFNFSVQCLVDVKVEFEDNGLVTLADKKVWRNYNIIRDGELVVDHVIAKLSEDAYKELKEAGGILYLGDKELTNGFAYDSSAFYTIKFKGIPLVSSNWARPNVLGFHTMLREDAQVSELLKQAKKTLKESGEPAAVEDSNDIYLENAPYESSTPIGKEVRCVTWAVLDNKGDKSPKYEGMNTREDVKKLSIQQKDLRFRCACIKWAYESSKSHRKSDYTWSADPYQKKAGSSKWYRETIVEIDGTNYRLERCEFTKSI